MTMYRDPWESARQDYDAHTGLPRVPSALRGGDQGMLLSETGTPVAFRVVVPPELRAMAPFLQKFVAGMVTKLYENKHKEPPRKMEALRFIMLMHGEMGEVIQQCYENRQDPNLLLELHDVANYAFLTGYSLHLEQEDHRLALQRLAEEAQAKAQRPRMFQLLKPLPELGPIQRLRERLRRFKNRLAPYFS